MSERGCRVHVLPATASVEDVLAVKPDGVFFSNGPPGDPAATEHPVELLAALLRRQVPYFGICFGNQIFGRALGLGTYKLKYGHRGINQPVKDLTTGKVEVTAHNHGFAVQAPIGGEDIPHRVRHRPGLPRRPQRRLRRGPGTARQRRPGRLLGAVPPRGRRRTARCGVPVRSLRRHDGGPPGVTPPAATRHVIATSWIPSTTSRPAPTPPPRPMERTPDAPPPY